MDIIQYLLDLIQTLYQQNRWLLAFICRYIPLRQWACEDSQSPKYQKFKTDEPPRIVYLHQDWDWKDLNRYYKMRYGKEVRPVSRRKACDIPEDCSCPSCGAPQPFLYRNNGKAGQISCKICGRLFSPVRSRFSQNIQLRCPFCGSSLVRKKNRKNFVIWKCMNNRCSYYLHSLQKVDPKDIDSEKYKYKLRYIYREFTTDFFKMDIRSLPKNASSLRFSKHSSYIMSLCLTFHVNLGLSLRKTAQALKDLYGIDISHQQVANYARTAALVIKPFTDSYDYHASSQMAADETYIRVRGVKGYLWIIIDALSRSILGYRVSANRDVGSCILTMRAAFQHFRKLPDDFRFIADGYSAYPLAALQFAREFGENFKFDITKVIGLTNNDAVSKEWRPYKERIERLNRTFKSSYRVSCGYDNYEGANYNVALWVTYYNFLRPHKTNGWKVLNSVEELENCRTMPDKWQMLMWLGQKTILNLQKEQAVCS